MTRTSTHAAPEAICVGFDPEEAGVLRKICSSLNWAVQEAKTWRRAMMLFDSGGTTIFLYDRDTNPAGWMHALEAAITMCAPSAFIMISRLADDQMWADLLNRGGYDLLLKPLNDNEVVRTLQSAHSWTRRNRVTDKALPASV